MQKRKLILFALTLMGIASLALPIQAKVTAGDITGGVNGIHVNIAIFHKLRGQDGFVYPKVINAAQILQALKDNAQFISINHSAGLKDGDILVLNSDVLREADASFEDFGVDCQLLVHTQKNGVTLAGMCEILMVDESRRIIEHKGIVKRISIKEGAGWQLIYYNAEDGIAVYADENVDKG